MNPACPEADAVQAYVDGAATLGERAAIEQHIRACGACRDVLMLAGTWQSEPAAPAAILARNATIDRFVVEGVLGAGGMGVVYAARDPELGRRVALKLLREESADRRERLAREAQALARVAHPNVCAVYDIGAHDGRLFIAMEIVEGQTLGRWAAQPRPWREVVAVFAAAARGLVAAHGAGVIHRDFKPDNVLVGDDGRVRVTDFGLASWLPEAAPIAPELAVDLTRSGAMLGTPRYMAPEQHAGEPADERSDQWSFAAALYEALYGRLPFSGNTAGELAAAKAAGRLPAAPSGRRVPRWLDRLVRRALAVRRADRWPSMAALADALERRRARRHLAWAAAVLGAAAIALAVALVAQRPADRDTDAARLAALAESMEAGLRIERLAPPHDLRPARARIRAEVERLRIQAGDGEGDDGAASFALGKGLELLGDDAGARDAYQRAWAAGFRMPRVADGLGTVLSNLYRREYRAAQGLLAGAAFHERVAALRRELAEPAMRYLAAGAGEPWRAAMHRGVIALLARDYPGARAAAAEALAADPGHYEARALEAEAWRSEALFLHTDRHDRTAPLTRALEAAEAAARFARSDQQLALLCIDLRWMLLLTPTMRGETTAAALDQLLAAVDDAAVLDPDEPQLLVARAKVLKQQVRHAQYSGIGNAGPLLEQAIAALRRAAELDGGEVTTLEELAQNLAIHGSAMTVRGDPDAALPFLDEGLRVIDRAVAREPRSAKTYARAQQLHKNRAAALKRQHHIAEHFAELRCTVNSGQDALRLDYEDSPMVQIMTGAARIQLAEDDWRSGRDPRPDARRGLALVEDGHRRSADDLWADSELILGRGRLAELLLRLGDDPAPVIAEARAAVDRALVLRSDAVWFRQQKGWLALLDARARIADGRDPGAALAESERLLTAVVPEADEDDGRRNLVQLAITRAHWQASRGKDPTALLRKAQADIDEQARLRPRWGEDLAAAAALEAALWARRSGRPAADDARRGLAAIEKVLSDDRRDVSSWVLKAALEALAGDRAQAQASLAKAAALNELVRRSRAYQDAEALTGP